MNRKKIVIIGATSAMAEHCARLWVTESPVDLILVGRNSDKLELIASDLRVRSPFPSSSIKSLHADFVDSKKIATLVDKIVKDGPVNIALIAHGYLPDQKQSQENLNLCCETLTVNGVSPVLFAEAFVGQMEKVNTGTIAIIGSVAGDRGRASNYIYGAAKGLVERYAEGLQHRLAKTDVKVVLIKPGPTDTPMTAHLKQNKVKLAPVESVAKDIVTAIATGSGVVYTPRIWFLIMLVIRHIPAFIFKHLKI